MSTQRKLTPCQHIFVHLVYNTGLHWAQTSTILILERYVLLHGFYSNTFNLLNFILDGTQVGVTKLCINHILNKYFVFIFNNRHVKRKVY